MSSHYLVEGERTLFVWIINLFFRGINLGFCYNFEWIGSDFEWLFIQIRLNLSIKCSPKFEKGSIFSLLHSDLLRKLTFLKFQCFFAIDYLFLWFCFFGLHSRFLTQLYQVSPNLVIVPSKKLTSNSSFTFCPTLIT